MPGRRTLFATSAFSLLLCSGAFAGTRLEAVASFSILGDFVEEVGGDRVELTTLVGSDGDGHVYEPTPADAEAVAGADVVIVNGLGFEGWLDRLIAASGTRAPVAVATEGVTPRAFGDHAHAEGEGHDHAEGEEHDQEEERAGHGHGAFDPHAWQSVPNAKVYVANIAAALSAADPAGADAYAANAAAYTARLDALDGEIRAAVAALPEDDRTIVTSHGAFGYFADAYGLTFEAPQAMSTESEASARDVAALITRIRDEGIDAVFVENIADPRLLEQIASETEAKIGGSVYSDALSGPDGPAPTYLDMMRHNLAQLTAALGS